MGAQRQYLYFCTSKASKWVYLRGGGLLVRVCVVHHCSADTGFTSTKVQILTWVYLRGGVLVRVCVVHDNSADVGARGVSKGGGEQRRLQ